MYNFFVFVFLFPTGVTGKPRVPGPRRLFVFTIVYIHYARNVHRKGYWFYTRAFDDRAMSTRVELERDRERRPDTRGVQYNVYRAINTAPVIVPPQLFEFCVSSSWRGNPLKTYFENTDKYYEFDGGIVFSSKSETDCFLSTYHRFPSPEKTHTHTHTHTLFILHHIKHILDRNRVYSSLNITIDSSLSINIRKLRKYR